MEISTFPKDTSTISKNKLSKEESDQKVIEMINNRMNLEMNNGQLGNCTSTMTGCTSNQTDIDDKLESTYAKSKKASPEDRSSILFSTMSRENIPETRAAQYPFRTVVKQFVEGKGSYSVEDIIEMMKHSAIRHNSLVDALAKVEKTPTN